MNSLVTSELQTLWIRASAMDIKVTTIYSRCIDDGFPSQGRASFNGAQSLEFFRNFDAKDFRDSFLFLHKPADKEQTVVGVLDVEKSVALWIKFLDTIEDDPRAQEMADKPISGAEYASIAATIDFTN